MSDRCTLELNFQLRDAPRIVHFLSGGEEVLPTMSEDLLGQLLYDTFTDIEEILPKEGDASRGLDTVMCCRDFDADFGCYDELMEAADAGLTFFGGHSSGSEYGEAVFAAYNYEVEWPSAYEGVPVAQMQADGTIPDGTRESILNYYRLYIKANEVMGLAVPKEKPKPRSVTRIIRLDEK